MEMELALLTIVCATLLWGALWIWYWFGCVDKISVHSNPTARNKTILNACPTLVKGIYRYPIWGWSGHAQAIYGAVLRRGPNYKYQRETLDNGRGMVLTLDWLDPHSVTQTTTTVVIVPGITGSTANQYIRTFSRSLISRGLRVVVLNWPGCGTAPLTSHEWKWLGDKDDIHQVFLHVHQKYPESSLVGIGISLGANTLLRYIGELGIRHDVSAVLPRLAGAIVLSQGFDVDAGVEILRRERKFYNWVFTNRLKKFVWRHRSVFSQESRLDITRIMQAKSIHEFDTHFTVQMTNKFRHSREHFEYYSSARTLHGVAIPLVIINAIDDPVIPSSLIPYDRLKANANIIMITTPHGGHTNWYEGFVIPEAETWAERLSAELVAAMVDINKSTPLSTTEQTVVSAE